MPDPNRRTFGPLTVRVERELCIGSGNCVKVAPEVFALDFDRIVIIRRDAAEIPADRLVEACQVCPVDALVVTDQTRGQVVPER